MELFIEMNDDILIGSLLLPSGTQTHGAGSNIQTRMQDEPHSSSPQGDRTTRRRRRHHHHHHHHQTPPSNQPATTVQQILHPGNLLRRLLPASSLFNSDSHTSWAAVPSHWNHKNKTLYRTHSTCEGLIKKYHACTACSVIWKCQENMQIKKTYAAGKKTEMANLLFRSNLQVTNEGDNQDKSHRKHYVHQNCLCFQISCDKSFIPLYASMKKWRCEMTFIYASFSISHCA